jgi:hypothetical protein
MFGGGAGHISDMIGRIKANRALLKKRRECSYHTARHPPHIFINYTIHATMERIFILVIVLLASNMSVFPQNLLLNGDFDETVPHEGDLLFYRKVFYASNWFIPTEGTTDIHTDYAICNNNSVFNMEPLLGLCVKTLSGGYAIGLHPILYSGYMEHITGTLAEPLIAGEIYEVSFHLKLYIFDSRYVAASKGIGFKFTTTPYVFGHFDSLGLKPWPYYDDLFKDRKVFADFEIDKYVTDTVWQKYSAVYKAKGGEKYITFGRFAYPDDRRIIRQVQLVRNVKNQKKVFRMLNKNNSLVVKQFAEPTRYFREDIPDNYYLLDRVSVVQIDKEVKNVEATGLVHRNDDKPMPSDPRDLKVFRIDPGVVGDLTFNLTPKLEPGEAMFVDYGKRHLVILINMDEKGSPARTIEYKYVRKARRLKGKVMRSYQKTLTPSEILSLQEKYHFENLQGQSNTILFAR